MSTNWHIPLVDLKAQYGTLKTEMDAAIAGIIEDTTFIKGQPVAAFEAAFAGILGYEPATVVGCSNGTSAVALALRAAGVGPGDEVVLPSHTFFATLEAVVNMGAIPVFADIRRSDYTIDPDSVADCISERTRAVIAVHIFGTPCDMTRLTQICDRHSLKIVEDCAQSHLANWDGKPVSTFGAAAGYSFYPGKNLGAYGDAGATVVKDLEQATFIRSYIDHGRSGKYECAVIADNLRLDALQAKVLSVKLPHLAGWTERRRAIAAFYNERFRSAGFKTIEPDKRAYAVYHVYVVEVANRDAVQKELAAVGIDTGIHYPIPCHAQPALATAEHRIPTPLTVTDDIVNRIVSLPIYPELTEEQMERVVSNFLRVAVPVA